MPKKINHCLTTAMIFWYGSIESAKNKIFLPGKQGLHPSRSLHNGGHLSEVYNTAKQEMSYIMEQAKAAGISKEGNKKYFQKKFLEFLNKERVALENGKRILNNSTKSRTTTRSKSSKINKIPKL